MAIEDFIRALVSCDPQLANELVSLDEDDMNDVILGVRYKQPLRDPNLLAIYSQIRRYVDQGRVPGTGF